MERKMEDRVMELMTQLESIHLHRPSDLHHSTSSKTQNTNSFSENLLQDYGSERCSKSLRSSFVEDSYPSNGLTTTCNQEGWEMRWTAGYGRYLITSRNITAGEVIFREKPLLLVPKVASDPLCLACLKTLDHKGCRCSTCGILLCSPDCPGGSHGAQECCLLSRLGLKSAPLNGRDVKELHALVGPLRALLLATESSAAREALSLLQSHKEKRMKLPIGRFVEDRIVKTLRSRLGLKVESEIIHHLCGVLDTNAFEVTLENGGRARAISVLASFLNHSCLPNAQRWYTQGHMTVRASVDILKGSPILINYTQTLWGTIARATHLSSCKMFTCQCKRCLDPMELGSHMSSVACRECQEMMTPPETPRRPWLCPNCGTSTDGSAIEALVRAGAVALGRLTSDDLQGMTSSLTHFSRMLGQNHYIVAQVKYALVQAIMKRPLKDVNFTDLAQVVDLTKELLKLAACIEPGLTRFRGLLLYDQTRAEAEVIDRCSSSRGDTNPEVRDSSLKDITASNPTETSTNPLQTLLYQAAECEYILQYDPLLQEVMELTRQLRWRMESDGSVMTSNATPGSNPGRHCGASKSHSSLE
ncbi:uncharacterized protein [Panulirus ornatus]|uniref:uncharacterized protein n=1 Tax=Panulirus ornatus TaxID=150431 RepID=UPI003A864EC6